MRVHDVAVLTDGIKGMAPAEGRVVDDFIRRTCSQEILELGFCHGVSTCYMAAALQEAGTGHILTIDSRFVRDKVPSIESLVQRAGLSTYATPVYAHSTYLWELMRLIEEQGDQGVCRPRFDFCFVDGAHTWAVDGFAFFLVDKLLRPGGWVLFDDLCWAPGVDLPPEAAWVRDLSVEERATPQMTKVFELLVRRAWRIRQPPRRPQMGLGMGLGAEGCPVGRCGAHRGDILGPAVSEPSSRAGAPRQAPLARREAEKT